MNYNWKEIFKAIPLPCLVLQPDTNGVCTILDANQAYLDLTGTEPAHILGKRSREAFPKNPEGETQGVELLYSVLKEVWRTGTKKSIDSMRYDIPIRGTTQFEQRHWSVENIPLKNSSGVVELILHTVKDITAEVVLQDKKKTFQAEMEVARQQYRNFIRKNPDGLFRVDLEGTFLHANDGLANLLDVPLKEVLGQNIGDFCAPYHKEKIFQEFSYTSKGKTGSFEADLLKASGTPIAIEILLMPMFLEGRVQEVHGIAKDISGIRESEKVLIEKSRFLEVNAGFISTLLENDFDESALYETFKLIGETVHADRMYYFGADVDPDTGETLISQKIEWCSSEASVQIDNPEMQGMPISQIEEITAPLIRNLPYTATLDTLKDGQMKDIFLDQDIQSMLLLPIIVDEKLYGFVGFDDCREQRTWNQEEITFLQSLTNNLTNAFEKKLALEKVRKREEELLRSERKFKALVQEGSDMIAILLPDGTGKFFSETSVTFFGQSTKDLVGKNLFEFVHPDDLERVQEEFGHLQEQRQVKSASFRLKNFKGNWRWIQSVATNLLHDPAVEGFVINSRDITTVVEQAREIEQINERYQLAAKATQDLIYDWDLENNGVMRFHRSVDELFGYTKQEMNNRDFWRAHIHPQDFQKESRKLAKTLSDPTADAIRSEYRFRRSDGTYAKVVDKGHIIRDSAGKAIRLVGATSDISDITAKREALKIANKRFEMAMKATNEMIWDWEISSDLVTRSKGYKSIFGYDTNEATSVHKFWLTKVDPQDQLELRVSIDKALSDHTQEMWFQEYRMTKADGTTAYVTDRGYIIRDGSGKATRMVGAVLDVTHSRKLIAKISKQNAVLKEIAWEQSHLVRAPLARIKGLLYILENENFDGISREQVLFHIRSSAEELDNIIRNIVGKTEEMDVQV